jgi:hypothetical protein
MGAGDLKLKFGSSRVKTNHVQALYKLAYILHDTAPTTVCTDKKLLTVDVVESTNVRRIAAVHIQALRAAPYERQLEALKNVIAPAKCTKQENTLPAALARGAGLAHTVGDTIALDLTQRRRKRTRRDLQAAGHRTSIAAPYMPGDGSPRGPRARTYLARSERAAL